jgi:hypothetical protein
VVDVHEQCDLACEIVKATRDGRDLFQTEEQVWRHGPNGDGWQLAFLQDAINGHLNEEGYRLLVVLHRQVLAGDYRYAAKEFLERFFAHEKEQSNESARAVGG